MSGTARILPLCTVADIHWELEDTERSLATLADRPAVDEERRQERRAILTRWHRNLTAQLAEMEAANVR